MDKTENSGERAHRPQPVTLGVARECTILDQRLAQIRVILLGVVGGALLLLPPCQRSSRGSDFDRSNGPVRQLQGWMAKTPPLVGPVDGRRLRFSK